MTNSPGYQGPFNGASPNSQPTESRSLSSTVEVHSIFDTIQGEGPFCGMPCVFVRLAGCNLQCPMCDTEYTSQRIQFETTKLAKTVWARMPPGANLVVITGGEPLRQPLALESLVFALLHKGMAVQVETNGTLPITSSMKLACRRYVEHRVPQRGLYIVCSPKTNKVHSSVSESACCYKYVLDEASISAVDGLPVHALNHPAKPMLARPPASYDRPIYVQPADTQDDHRNKRNVKAAVWSCTRHGYTLQLQIHKLIGVA